MSLQCNPLGFLNLTESDYMKSLHSLLKQRVANGLTQYGKTFGFSVSRQ